MTTPSPTSVLVIGGGFAGVGCATELAKHGVPTTLIDRHNYHQFQPLLYQVATGQLASSDVARPLREIFRTRQSVDVQLGEITSIDLATKTATTADGSAYQGEQLVLAAGTLPRFFHTPGATEHTFPLYSLDDALALRSRILDVFEEANRDPQLVARGALTFVVIGGGATGVETAGSLADLVFDVMPDRYRDLPGHAAQVHLVEHGPAVLAPFSERTREYAASALTHKQVHLHLGVGASEVHADRVVLSDGTVIPTRTVVWAAGIRANPLGDGLGLDQVRDGRIPVQADLTIEGHPDVYALGDQAAIPGPDGRPLPQLGSVALQSGVWAAKNIVARRAGKDPKPFHYKDKGIMAMIGRNAAVAEVGAHHHRLHGPIAFSAWLGVHAWLLSGVRERIDAFVSWGWDYFSENREYAVLDHDAGRIDWSADD